MVIRFLHLDKNEGKTVNEQRDVRSEVVFTIAASKFSREMEDVILWIFKVD